MNRFAIAKRDGSLFNSIALETLLFATILLLFFIGLNSVTKTTKEEEFKATKQAIVRSVVHCYAIEGAYPPSVNYLEKLYGLTINYDKYKVEYNRFASNLMPDITVIKINDIN